jgi:hypothetical protein
LSRILPAQRRLLGIAFVLLSADSLSEINFAQAQPEITQRMTALRATTHQAATVYQLDRLSKLTSVFRCSLEEV